MAIQASMAARFPAAFTRPLAVPSGTHAFFYTSLSLCQRSQRSPFRASSPGTAAPAPAAAAATRAQAAESPMPPPRPSPTPPPRRRETDERGFVVPVPGDIVTYAGRWPGEDAAGLVERVRYVAARRASVVDLVELRAVAPALYAPSRRRRWCDIADVRLAADAEYVPAQDAYRILSVRTGYARVRPLDADAKARADGEYARLKQKMLRTTLMSAAVGTALSYVVGGKDLTLSYFLGSAASILYLVMLHGSVDAVGSRETAAREASILSGLSALPTLLLRMRFLVPAIPFAAISLLSNAHGAPAYGTGHASTLAGLLGSLSRSQVAAIVLGLLTYKVPIVLQTASEAVDTIAEADIGTGSAGMLGAAATLAARAVRRRAAGQPVSVDAEQSQEMQMAPIVVVIAGPSGVGKSSLLRRLFGEFPGVFDFSISHTTRSPRQGEVEGVAYHFVDTPKFQSMIRAGDFVEYAQVHGNYYGTSFDSIDAVLASKKLCVLDLDVQGVKALSTTSSLSWSPRFVWIAPPSIKELEERLRRRGSETPETSANRLDTAMREMSFAATSNIFDITIINQDFDEAYNELKQFIESVMQESVSNR